jgi:hypothetical protein
MVIGWKMRWLVAVAMIDQAYGTVVQRCEGPDGALTFTHLACPNGQAGEAYPVFNPPPGSVAPPSPARPRAARPKATEPAPPPQAPPKRKAKVERKKKTAKYTPWRP